MEGARKRARAQAEPCAFGAALEQRVLAGEDYDRSQNGHIRDLRTIDIPALRAEMAGLRTWIDGKFGSLETKIDKRLCATATASQRVLDTRDDRGFRVKLLLYGSGLSIASATLSQGLALAVKFFGH